MPTYAEHQQLLDLLDELIGHMRAQARELSDLVSPRAEAPLPPDGPLSSTWPLLQTSFQLLARHAVALEAELTALESKRE